MLLIHNGDGMQGVAPQEVFLVIGFEDFDKGRQNLEEGLFPEDKQYVAPDFRIGFGPHFHQEFPHGEVVERAFQIRQDTVLRRGGSFWPPGPRLEQARLLRGTV